MSAKSIVLINDLPGFGKVALAGMVPILSHRGCYTYQLPTAVISNTLDYGRYEIADMTDYMRGTLRVWDELGIDPDCIATGFVLSEEQVDIILDYINSRNTAKERLILVDPIMADGGKLYNGIGPERVTAFRRLIEASDVAVPNLTEALLLTDDDPAKGTLNAKERKDLIDALRDISKKSVVITGSVDSESGAHLVSGYDHIRSEYFDIPFEFLPVKVAGSGDVFSAVLLSELLNGASLKEASGKAVCTLFKLIEAGEADMNDYKGIVVEKYLDFY